jgi:trk system potassium uptake protein TrkA
MRQFAVIGLGRFGLAVLKTLAAEGCEVIGIDESEERVQEVTNIASQAVQLDATDEKALQSVGIADVDVAIVSVGEKIQSSILIALLLKELGVKEIVARAVTLQHGKVLEKIGVNRVVYPEIDMGTRVAKSLVSTHVREQIELFSDEYSVMEVILPPKFVGKSLRELDLRAKYGVNVIAIKKKYTTVDDHGEVTEKFRIENNPNPDDIIGKDDVLLFFGKSADIEKIAGKE